jgi:hypothetical protein
MICKNYNLRVYNIKSTIEMISKNTILILVLLCGISVCQLCPSPQKSFYMSYNAISNHDYLTNVF